MIVAFDESRVVNDGKVDAAAEGLVNLILYGVVPRVATDAGAQDIV